MDITIKNDKYRFGVRVGAIILNRDENKILVQKQNKIDEYIIPGGRLNILEDTQYAITRELDEELGIVNEEVRLKYIIESNIKNKYHEIGFYYIVVIDEIKYNINDGFKSLDLNEDESLFKWIDIDKLNNYELLINCLGEKIISRDYRNNSVEHIIYKK